MSLLKSKWSAYSLQSSRHSNGTFHLTRPSPSAVMGRRTLPPVPSSSTSTFSAPWTTQYTTVSDMSFVTSDTSSQLSSRRRTWRAVSIAFHVLLLVIHIVLVIICMLRVEHKITFELGLESNRASFIILFVSQTIAVIYSALLIFLMQRLVMFQQRRRLITATESDGGVDAAWLGLGSGILALWKQTFVFRSELARVLGAVLYLACIATFQIVAPSMLTVETYNHINPLSVDLLGLPNYANVNTTAKSIGQAHDMLPFVSLLPPISTLGLDNGILYDIPQATGLTGSIDASAFYFNVTCNAITDGAAAMAAYLSISTSSAFTSCAKDRSFGVCCLSQDALLLLPSNSSALNSLVPPSSIFIVSSSMLVDSAGSKGWIVEVSPSLNYTGSSNANRTGGLTIVSRLQFLACSLSLDQHVASIDLQSRLPHSMDFPSTKTQSSWKDVANSSGIVSSSTNAGHDIITRWSEMITSQRTSQVPIANTPTCIDKNACLPFSYPEIQVLKALGLTPDGLSPTNSSSGPESTPYLHNLENALSRISASLFWTDLYVQPAASQTDQTSRPVPIVNTTTVQESFSDSHLSLNSVPVVIGLVISIQMLFICISICVPLIWTDISRRSLRLLRAGSPRTSSHDGLTREHSRY